MNVRLSKESVRFRVSKEEFSGLIEGREILEESRFATGSIRYSVKQGSSLSFVLQENELAFNIPQDQIEALSRLLGDKNARIRFDADAGEGRVIGVSLEVDLFSLKEDRPKR